MKNSKCNLWKLLWQHAPKFITLILVAQVGVVQASEGNATNSIPTEGSTDEPVTLYTSTEEIGRSTPIENRSMLLINTDARDNFENVQETLQTNASTDTISQELKKTALRRFDQIHNNLQDIITMLNANKSDGSECNVTQDALSELNNVINGTLSINTTQTEMNCESNPDKTNSCDEILKLIQCGVNHLKVRLIDSTQNIISLEEYIKLNNELYKKFQKISDQINQQTSQKHKKKLDECDMNIRELHKYLNRTISQLKEEIKGLCISEIGNGHIKTAVKKFKELNAFDDDHLVRNIIEKAYKDYGQLNNFDNIIDFIAELRPWFSQMVTSFEALFDNMEKNTSKILIFVTRVRRAKKLHASGDENSFIARLDNLNSKALIHVNNFSNAWVHKIHNNDYDEIIKFSETYPDAINFYLDRLIEKTYDNDLKNAEKIIEFTRKLSTINSSILSLHSLFNRMKNHGHDLDSYELLMLAYYCKELMLMNSYDSLPSHYKEQLMAIKTNLYDSVRRLIWDGSDCTMRNRLYDEYLYAANASYARDKQRRRVYTLRTGNINVESHWKITPKKYGKFFSVQNIHYNNEYLYAAADDLAYDSARRNVFTWRDNSDATGWTYWRFVPVNNGKYFLMQYKDYHFEYLYPGYDKLVRDKEARYVFTWRKIEDTPTKEGHWEIYC